MKRLFLTTSLAAAAIAAGCGGSGGDPDADPASVVPARAPVYIEATINPDGETADEIKALSQKLAGTDQPGAELKKLFERAVNENGQPGNFKWDEDVAPWIGDRIGVYVTSITASGEDADAAIVAPTEDPDKAKEFLEKDLAEKGADDTQAPKVADRTYKDVEYKVDTANEEAVAILGDFAVVGTEPAVKGGIDAQEGEGLAEADAFKQARDQVADDGVGFAYVRLSTLFSGLGPQGAAARQLFAQAGDSIAMALDTDADAIRVETAAIGAKGGASGDPGAVVAELPGDSWLALGTADIGAQLEQAIEQIGQLGALGGADPEQAIGQLEQQLGLDLREDVLSWMGDGAVFVRGETLGDIGGALVVASKDAAKTEQFVTKMRSLAGNVPGTTVEALRESGVDAGFTLGGSQLPVPVHVAAAGERFIVAATDGALEAALNPSGKLADSAVFKTAAGKLGDGMKPSFFLDMAPVRSLVDASGSVQGDDAQKARRALDSLTAIVAGGSRDGEVQRGRMVVGVK